MVSAFWRTALAAIACGGCVMTIGAANYSAWTHQTNILINTSPSGVPITSAVYHFPVLMRLTSSNFTFSQAKAGGADLRFAKSDGTTTALSYQIERWDATAQVAEIWVTIDTIRPGQSAQGFIMYWGNTSATSESNSSEAFDTAKGFSGVWHMFDATDATKNASHFVTDFDGNVTPVSTTGMVGSGYYFDGNSFLEIPDGPALNTNGNFSVSAWVKYEQTMLGWLRLFDRGASGWKILYSENDSNNLMVSTGTTVYSCDSLVDNWTHGNWHHLVFTFSSDTLLAYCDGNLKATRHMLATSIVPKDSVCTPIIYDGETLSVTCDITYDTIYGAPAGPADNGQSLFIGAESAIGPSWFTGRLDEVRLDRRIESADWIKLCYENQKVNQGLLTIGGQIGIMPKDNRSISYVKKQEKAVVSIYNVKGSCLNRQIMSTSDINNRLKQLQPGMYMVTIQTDKMNCVVKRFSFQ